MVSVYWGEVGLVVEVQVGKRKHGRCKRERGRFTGERERVEVYMLD